jgi:hypothetical protein
MKKQILIIGLVAMLATSTGGVFTASARHGHHRPRPRPHHEYNIQAKQDARGVLRRTARVLQRAQDMAAHKGRPHRHRRHGLRHRGLGRAFAFQERARDLFFAGNYEDAIYLSLRSRAIALRVIRRMEGWDNDHGNWRDDDDFRNCEIDRSELDSVEIRYWNRRPGDDKLDVYINGHEVSDDVAVSFRLKLDF